MTKSYIVLLLGALLAVTQFVKAAGPQLERPFECFFCSLNRSASSTPAMNPQFQRLKALAGTWAATDKKGKNVKVVYTVISNGSALLENLMMSEGGSMATIYHQDGERLMVTHYCSTGNQPRMVASARPDNELAFSFFDATNLANSADQGHMQGLKFRFQDRNHFTQEWTFHWNSGREEVQTLNLHRIT